MTQQHNYWRADITGLRALAVIPVVLYHAFPGLMPGGFVGVDIFFVISGYLISGIIFRSLIAKNRVDYVDFYAKRIRRILPNLLLLLCFCLVVGYFFLFDDELFELSRQTYSSAGFYQNFRLLEDVDYFAPAAERQPLLHLWSLAIEEQFYIFFPLLCGVIWRFTKSVRALGILVGAITLGSLAFCLSVPDQRFNFYFPLTRFWELGFGIVLSYAETFKIWSAKNWALSTRNGMSVTALLMLVAAFLGFDHDTVFPGVASLLPVLGAVLLISSHEDAVVNRWLTGKSVVFVGLISYSLYLWHWPFLVFQKIVLPTLSWGEGWALLLSVAVSIFIYRFVEVPARKADTKAVYLLLLAMMLVVGSAQGLKKSSHEACARPGLSTFMSMLLEDQRQAKAWDVGARLKGDIRSMQVGDGEGNLDLLLVGDSHMEQNLLRFKYLSERLNLSMVSLTHAGTLAAPHVEDPDSMVLIQEFENLLINRKPKVVVWAQKWGIYAESSTLKYSNGVEKISMSEGGFVRVLSEFRGLAESNPDVRFFFILDAPWDDYSYHYPNRTGRAFVRQSEIAAVKSVDLPVDNVWRKGNELVAEGVSDFAVVIDPLNFVCPKSSCNLFNYKDDDHLRQDYVREHGVWLDPIFEYIRSIK